MAGLLCLQGGRELTPECSDLDALVLGRVDEPVVVLAGAARQGQDYAGASARAIAHYASLGAEVVAAPDPRDDGPACRAALGRVGLLVLPGGSPASLRDVLTGPVGERVVELHFGGTAISGASAGAMVLCDRLVVPDRGATMADGLALAPGLALPHWSSTGGPSWATEVEPTWGLPECGGVVIEDDRIAAAGSGEPSIRVDGSWRPVPREWTSLASLLAPSDAGDGSH